MPDPGWKLQRGIALFDQGDFLAAHEEFESVWNAVARPERFFVQALIHCAAAWQHAARGNLRGAVLQTERGLRKLAAYLPVHANVDTARLYRDALGWRGAWSRGETPSGRATIGVKG